MDKNEILADLRQQFGEKKSVLYADELAQVLGKSTKAIYDLKNRGGLPVPVLPGEGRPCVSIHAVADWLAGGSSAAYPGREGGILLAPAENALQPARKPKKATHQSMAAYLSTLRGQMDFLHQLHSEMERIIIDEESREAAEGEGEGRVL